MGSDQALFVKVKICSILLRFVAAIDATLLFLSVIMSLRREPQLNIAIGIEQTNRSKYQCVEG